MDVIRLVGLIVVIVLSCMSSSSLWNVFGGQVNKYIDVYK